MVLSRTPKIAVRIAGVLPQTPAHTSNAARRKSNPEIGDQLDYRNGDLSRLLTSVLSKRCFMCLKEE